MKWTTATLAAGSAVLALAGWWIAEREEGFLAPAIAPDNQVYFLRRVAAGAIFGLGWEFFTPPANVLIWSDKFQLCRARLDREGFEVLATLEASPLEGRWIHSYRSRSFTVPMAATRVTGDQIEWELEIQAPRQPSAESFLLRGQWNWKQSKLTSQSGWKPGSRNLSPGEDVLREPWEVLTLRAGNQALPCAVAAHSGEEPAVRVLAETADCRNAYDHPIAWKAVESESRRAQIRHMRELRSRSEALTAENRRAGMNEGAAMLAAGRQLAEEGYYPKPAQWIADLVNTAPPGPPVFAISEQEFLVGLFPDIQEAIENSGHEVEKPAHPYIAHRDFDTSRRLNDYLAGNPGEIYVRRQRHLYRLRVIPPRPPIR